MNREQETRRAIEYHFKTNRPNINSRILANIAISLAMIVDILNENEQQKGDKNDRD